MHADSSDDVLGGGDTYRMHADEVETTKTLLTQGSYPGEVGRELDVIVAEPLQQAGWAAVDIGPHHGAQLLRRVRPRRARGLRPRLRGQCLGVCRLPADFDRAERHRGRRRVVQGRPRGGHAEGGRATAGAQGVGARRRR
ncbi:MAG TPA: hypothetical protein VGL46_09270 [Pseudonocardiaceae bacterium]